MECFGRNLNDHCCYIEGKQCPFLEENTERGQRWSCQLRRETGSWDAAIADPRYTDGEKSPGRFFSRFSYKNCRDFQCKDCIEIKAGTMTLSEMETKRNV